MRFDVNLKQLKTFYYVGRYLSFRQAAEALHITQPAVTMQVRSLEEHLGARLFAREGNRVALTGPGVVLFRYAERIMELATEAEQAVERARDPVGVTLRIGTTRVYARRLLPPCLLAFREACPAVQVQVSEGSSAEVAVGCLHGQNDLALVGRVVADERLETRPFPGVPREELLAIVPPDHPLAGREAVSAVDLGGQPLILREPGSAARERVLGRFREEDASPTVLLEARTVDFIRDLVRTGAGIGITGRLGVQDDLDSGTLRGIPFDRGGLAVRIDLVVPREGLRPRPVEAFLDFLKIWD